MKRSLLAGIALLVTISAVSAQTVERDDALLWLDFEEVVNGGFECAVSDRRAEVSGTPQTQDGAVRASQFETISVEGLPSDAPTNQLTLAAWVAPTSHPGSYQSILYRGLRKGPEVQDIHFYLCLWEGRVEFKFKDAEGTWRGIMRNGDNFTLPGAAAVPASDVPQGTPEGWDHIPATFDQGEITVYLNGEEVLSATASAEELTPSEHPLLIGEAHAASGPRSYIFDGLIDSARVLSRALTADEMADLYNAEREAHPDEPLEIARALPEGYDPDFETTLPLVEQWDPPPSEVRDQTTASVRMHNGAPVISIDDEPFYPMALMPEPYASDEDITLSCRDFSAAGLDIFSDIFWSWSTPREGCHGWWLGEGEYDFDRIDARVRAILEANPNARFFPRVKLNPPGWWMEAHPDHVTINADGTKARQVSLASKEWQEAYERMLRDVIRHMESTDYAGHIIGYQPAGGRASEWYWYGDRRVIDFAPAAIERWREWLSNYYEGDLPALREAWGRPDATFADAQPPTVEEREASHHGLFRDPVRGRKAMDYLRFLTDMVTSNIVRSCGIVKEETGGEKLAGVFYGYSIYTPRQDGFQGLERVLASEDVDFLASPTAYDHRRGGEPGSFVSTYFGSYRLHNKLFWDEVDTRTHLYPGYVSYRTADLPETLSVLRRAVGHSLTRGTGLWWFLLTGNATFHQVEIMDDIASLKAHCDDALEVDREQVAEVAVFADEPSMYYTAESYTVLRPYLRDTVDELARMGAPYDIYLMSDIASEDLPEYSLYIFLNAWAIDDEMRAAIDAEVRRDGKTAVWVYAPGYVADGEFSEAAMAEMTGITLRAHEEPVEAMLSITGEHPIVAAVPGEFAWHWEVAPAFSVDDPQATVLGTVAERPALAVREFDGWRSVYSMVPLRREVLHGLCEYAGVHVYSDTFDTFHANRAYATLHTAEAGEKRIELREGADVTELVTGESLGHTSVIEATLPESVTRIYRLEH